MTYRCSMSRTATTEPPPAHRDLAEAAHETWAIWAGLFALGIGFGVLVTDYGLAWWLAR